jgi:uncharacterized membrane protein
MSSLKKFFESNIFKIFFLSFFVCITILCFYHKNVISNNYQFLVLGIILLFEIALFKVLDAFNNKVPLYKLYLMLIIPIGLLYMLSIPVGRVPDESGHFFRAYEISEGHLVSDFNGEYGGRNLPISLIKLFDSTGDHISYSDELNDLNQNIDKKQKDFAVFSNTSLYSFVCYLPQTIGVFVGRVLNLNPLIIAYLGRITNFIICICILAVAIKIFPGNKKLIFFISFMPMFLQELVSLSPDAITNSLSILLLSYVLYLKNNKSKINNKELVLLSIICIILSQCKIVYLPLCLSVFMIPFDKFNSKRDKYIKIGIIAFLTVALNLIWLSISSKFLIEYNEGVNSAKQVMHIFKNPLNYIIVLFRTIKTYGILYLKNIVGQSLCYFDVNISIIIAIIYYIIMIINGVFNNIKLELKNRLLSLFIVLSTLVLIFTSLYVQWTPVNNPIIDGVQGRYLIPLLIFGFSIFNFKKNINSFKSIINYYSSYLIIAINIYVVITLFIYHL